MKIQKHLREAIGWVEKGYVSKEEFAVLKHKIFQENKEEGQDSTRDEEDRAYVAAAKRAQEQVEKLVAENALLKAANAHLNGYCVDCSSDGVEYTRDEEGIVYNADFEEAGKWCTSFGDGFIEFSNEGAKKHFEATGRSLPC